MRIAVSDFDGTIMTGGKIRGDVPAAVRAWRAAGNAFGIATGRDMWMTVHETDRWDIPFDFLVCINGAALYDADRRTVLVREFAPAAAEAILRHPAALASEHYLLLGDEPIRFYQRSASWFPGMGIAHTEVDFETACAAPRLAQISLSYQDDTESAAWQQRLDADFAGSAAVFRNGRCIDINPPGVCKASGIRLLLEKKGCTAQDVIVMGDGGNDAEMFREYRGFCVPNAIPEIKALAAAEYPDAAAVLYAHLP